MLLRDSALFTGMNLESKYVNDNDLYARALLSSKSNVKSVCLHIIINFIGQFSLKICLLRQWTSAYDKFYDFGAP